MSGGEKNVSAEGINLVGASEEEQEVYRDFLERNDPCFGCHFAKTADECKECTAVVEYNGRLHTLRELCKAKSEGKEDPINLKRLSSQDVISRLRGGKSVAEIWWEILDGTDPDEGGTEAWRILYNRLRYLEKEKGLPVPDLKPTKMLLNDLQED